MGNYVKKLEALEAQNADLRAQLQGAKEDLAEVRQTSRLYAQAFHECPFGCVVHNGFGVVIATNPAGKALLGREQAIPGFSLIQAIANEDIPTWLSHLRHSHKANSIVRSELSLKSKGGGAIPVELATISKVSPDQAQLFHTAIWDIRERKSAEARLRRSQQNFHLLLDTGIVWEADARTLEITFVNRYAERLLGYPAADWLRPNFWQDRIYYEDRERVANCLAVAIAAKQDLQLEYRVLTASREVRWLHDTIRIAERDGRLMLLGVAIDVTQRSTAEQQLRELNEKLEQRVAERTAELQKSLGELEAFSYSISHDLRSPIRAMIGYAELAQRKAEGLSPEIRSYLEGIARGANRADRLIRDVLTYSQVSRQSIQLVPVDLNKMLPELARQVAEQQSRPTEIEIDSPLLPVLGHEPSLAQCLTNLLTNASKFVAPDRHPKVRVGTETMAGKVKIWVEDNGIGIEAADRNRIFGIFERLHAQTEFEGTGIGLAIVRKAIERLGGTVGVESEPGQGSRFWIQLNAPSP